MAIRISPDVTTLVADANTPIAGNVQLVSGTNVTLTQSGQAITVAAASSSGPPITQNDEGTFTVPTTGRLLQPNRLTLSGSERATLAGTGRIPLGDVLNYEPSKGATITGSFNIMDTEYEMQFKRLALSGNSRLTEIGTGREVLADLGLSGVVNAFTSDGTTMTLISPKIVTSVNDVNANTLLGITATGGAVNDIRISNAATGTDPGFTAEGTDTNVGIKNTLKGTGVFTVTDNPGAAGRTSIQFVNTNGTSKSSQLSYYASASPLWSFGNDAGAVGANDFFVFNNTSSNAVLYWDPSRNTVIPSNSLFGFGSSTGAGVVSLTIDTGLGRNAAQVVEVNNGTLGQFGDMKFRNLFLTGTGPAPITQNDYTSGFTVPTTGTLLQPNRSTLSGTERATATGTGRVAISDQGPTNTPLSKVTLNPTSFIIRAGEYVMQYLRLALAGNTRATLTENARIVNFEFRPPSHLVLAGAGL